LATKFCNALNKKGIKSNIFTLYKINQNIKIRTESTDLLPDNKNALRKKIRKLILNIYCDYFNIFSKAELNKLLKLKGAGDHLIYLQNSKGQKLLGFAPFYKLILKKLLKICKYVLENLAKGFIEPSSAVFAAPILFAYKANKKLRFYINYQYLNALIKKN